MGRIKQQFAVFFSIFVFLQPIANAQGDVADSTKHDVGVEQKDIYDIGKQLFHLKAASVPDSLLVKPGKLLFAVVPGFGYAIQTGFTFVTNINLSFYADTSKNANLSVIRTMPEASFTHGQIMM